MTASRSSSTSRTRCRRPSKLFSTGSTTTLHVSHPGAATATPIDANIAFLGSCNGDVPARPHVGSLTGAPLRATRICPELHQPAAHHGGLDEPRVIVIFDDLRQNAVGRHAGETHAALIEASLVVGVDLVAVAVALGDL